MIKRKINNIITKDIETLNYSFLSKKINNFSKINFKGLYDLKKEINKEYTIGYSYFDECFGINLDFNRKSYEEDNLKPQDILTLMFSFKNIGSYKSNNLALSNIDNLDINWENYKIDNDKFEKINKKIFIIISILLIILIYSKIINSKENKIIFKINETAYTSYDYEMRIKYDFIGENNNLDKEVIINDLISVSLFLEYYKNGNNQINFEKRLKIFF